jgi:hypothetical protein
MEATTLLDCNNGFNVTPFRRPATCLVCRRQGGEQREGLLLALRRVAADSPRQRSHTTVLGHPVGTLSDQRDAWSEC